MNRLALVWGATIPLWVIYALPYYQSGRASLWLVGYFSLLHAGSLIVDWAAGYKLAASYESDGRVTMRHLLAGVGATLILFSISQATLYVLLAPFGFFRWASLHSHAFSYNPLWVMLHATALAAGHVLYYEKQLERRETLALRLNNRLVIARANTLQAQLNPHFLFNALNAISALASDSPELADQAIVRLKDLLKLLLQRDGSVEVTLQEEVRLLRSYVELEQMRFGDRLEVTICFVQKALHAKVPPLILQPVVENAIRHGAAVLPGNRWIQVTGGVEGGRLRLVVRDNGPGLPANHVEGIGIGNTRERLADLYGNDYRFDVSNIESGGCEVTIEFPFQ